MAIPAVAVPRREIEHFCRRRRVRQIIGEAPRKITLPNGSEMKVMAENTRALYTLPVCAGRV